MYYQDLIKIAKEYSKTFNYSFSIRSLKSKMLWASVLSLITMMAFYAISVQKQPPMPDRYAFWCAMFFEALSIVFYATHVEQRKKSKQTALGVFDPIRDKDRQPLDIRADWLAEKIPYPREQYSDLVDALERLEARLNNRLHKINIMEAYMKGVLSWTKRTKSIATLIFIPVSVYTIQALLEDKPWIRPIKPTVTTENIETASILILSLVVFSIIIAAFASTIKLAFEYWLDVVTLHGCSNVSIARLANDLLRLSKLNPGTPTSLAEDQSKINL